MSRQARSPGDTSPRSRSGATLLEVIVALAILAIGGLAIMTHIGNSLATVERTSERERAMRDASRFMESVSLWPTEDLNARLGVRTQGSWRLHITRVSPSLYDVQLLDSTGTHILLSTSLWRPIDHKMISS